MHPPSVPLVNLLVRFSKTFLNLARHLKLTQSLNVKLNWDTNQLRRTRRRSNSIGHQLSKRLYSSPLEPALRPVALLAFCQLPEVTQATGLLPTQSLRLGPDWTTKPCGSVLLFCRPQCLPCTPVSMWGYCQIRHPSSTFMPFQCWSISPTLRDQQHHKKII